MVHHLDRSQLVQHYNENDCDNRHDLKISVLEHAKGSSDYMRHTKNKWIITMQTYASLGLYPRVCDFGYIHQSVFSKRFLINLGKIIGK